MENKNTLNVQALSKKFMSIDTTIEGPLTSSNDKQYMKAKFEVNTADDDGYSGQSKAYVKVFFEDTHSLLYMKAQKALENNLPLKILAARIIMPTSRDFYILDPVTKERMIKKDKTYRKASSITLFLIADENPITAFNQACNQITENNAWIEPVAPEEDHEA
jgi:hypothetical protein